MRHYHNLTRWQRCKWRWRDFLHRFLPVSGAEYHEGLVQTLQLQLSVERHFMSALQQVRDALSANIAATAALKGAVAAQGDLIVLVINALKDLRASGGATAAELTDLLSTIEADTAATKEVNAKVIEADTKIAEALGATDPAPAPSEPTDPLPTVDPTLPPLTPADDTEGKEDGDDVDGEGSDK